jgi:hypothetical protein
LIYVDLKQSLLSFVFNDTEKKPECVYY